MAKQTGKPRPRSGGAKLKASGRVAIMIGVTPEERDRLKAAAESDNRTTANFVKLAALVMARRLLGGGQ